MKDGKKKVAQILVASGCFSASTLGFQSKNRISSGHSFVTTHSERSLEPTRLYSTIEKLSSDSSIVSEANSNKKFWELGPTLNHPERSTLTPELAEALEKGIHPAEDQSELGRGIFVTRDWRKAWYTYQSPPDHPNLIDPKTGFAEYTIDESMIDGRIPEDLVGCLYRNGPGKFGVGGERVQHALDADGLVFKIDFPARKADGTREFKFVSRFVETEQMKAEADADEFLYRSTFGTGPWGFAEPPRRGLNEDPWEVPLLSKLAGNALKTDIKNSANTQVISFGGKVLALFEAGLPHRLDPTTLESMGEDTLGGVLKSGTPVKLGDGIPEDFTPDFLGGTAHTAHPNRCPDTGNLVGWHWSQLPTTGSLEVTVTEWSEKDFAAVASETFVLENCELAPHDMALTENCVLLKVNSLKLNQLQFLSGNKGPAASLEMDGRANVLVHVLPRPTAQRKFEPFVVEVPACFSIHFSHAYEDPQTGNIRTIFSGWPPSDQKDFLGAWGGFAPVFERIPQTCLWELEIDPVTKTCVKMGIAPGAANACAEHPLVHPNFVTKKAKFVYASASNLVGDSSAPCGFLKACVEDEDATTGIPAGTMNETIDAWWFGTRRFSGEPLIVPKNGGNPNDERAAYLIGVVFDAVTDKSAIVVFDLEQELKEGPIATAWLKSAIPHGLHGCFAQDGDGAPSVFC